MRNNIDNYPDNAIKSFLRIETPKIKDFPFYEIDTSKNLITLYNPSDKKPSDRSSTFELDKIFTNENENSYIFEEICLNTIKDCLEGFSYSFISYGETSSKKIDVLIGNIEDSISNINHRGIYPRLLEGLMKKIKKNEIKENKFNILMSFFMVYKNNLIDLSVLKDMDNKNIGRNNLFSKTFIIKNETDIINNISKIKIGKIEEHLLFINKILSSIFNIEKNTKENIFSSSHICLVLYLTNKQNNQIIKTSNISFIILNGSEYLYSSENEKLVSQEENNNVITKKVVEGAKKNLETQFTFETVYNCLKSVKCLDNEIYKAYNINKKENLLFSNLTTVLYNICFGDAIEKIKFRIIGTIYPNTGFHQSVKDTVLFLYDCRNIIKRKKDEVHNFENLYDTSAEIIEKKKDDYIFQLENKVKSQKKRIDELSKNLSKKENKITFLQNTYIEQINTVKKKLNFPGDISVLIAGDENTKEANFVREMREYQDVLKRNEGNIHILEKKLKLANDEILKLKNKNIVKNSDETMVNYYLSLRQAEENRNKEDNSIRILYKQIDGLKQEIKAKDQINSELKKEIQKKNDILFNLPLSFKENYTLNKDFLNNKNKENSIKSDKLSENKKEKLSGNNNSESDNLDNDIYYGEKIQKINEENKKNMEILKLKYETILADKNKEFEDININIKNNNDLHKKEIFLWKNELIKYNEKFMELLSNYKRIFFSKFPPQYSIVTLKNKKEEFDNILFNLEKEINHLNFPKLFHELEAENNLGITVTGSAANMRKTLSQKISKNIISKENNKKSESQFENYKKNMPPIPVQKIKNSVEEMMGNKKIIRKKEDLEFMSKEAIIIHCLDLNKKVEEIENFLEKYTQYRKGFNIEEFENNINYKENTIKELNEKINKLRNDLDDQIQANYNSMNVINTQNRIIDKFQREKFLSSILGKNKNKNYNASMHINENSTYSTLIHSINKNNNVNNFIIGGNRIKKSNSCLDLNANDNREQQISKRDGNFYFPSTRIKNEYIKKNNEQIKSKMRPFSSMRQLKKKKLIN